MQRRGRPVVSTPQSVPAPIGGWNTKDSIANMPVEDAILLDDFFPTPTDVMLRMGWADHVTGIPDLVESLLIWNGGASSKMFGASGSAIYNVTSVGAVGAAVVSGLTNARWQFVNISTSGGNFMYAVNGEDKPQIYDGTTWTAVDAASTPAITGVTTTDLSMVQLFKERLWFIEKDTLSFWYLPVDAIGGAATEFPLNSVARKGGYLVSMGGWTIDAGEGVDDYFAFITSQGEVIVYKGTDPSSASTWALVGIWSLGAPIGGPRCLAKYGGDLLYFSVDGLVPLSTALLSSRTNQRVAITDKIQKAINDAITLYGANYGWEVCFFPIGNMILINVPVQEGLDQNQYVMNTISKAWGRFTGYSANCFAVFNDELYFGGDGFVAKAWSSFTDNGDNIVGNVKQSFNYFGARGLNKIFKMVQPVFATDGIPAVALTMNVDYADQEPGNTAAFVPATYAVWDSATWDVGVWGGGLSVLAEWQTLGDVGVCGAFRMQIESQGIEVRWQVTNHIYEKAKGALI